MNQPISIPIARHLREPYLIVQTPKMIAQSKGSPRKIVRSPQPARVSDRIARAMFGAPSALRTEAERRRARLLAAFDVVAGVPLLFGAIQVGLLDPQPGEAGVAWLLAGGAAWALCAYLLSRTGQLRIAAGLTIALLWLAPATYLGIEAHHGHAIAPWTAAWLAIPILVAGGIARPAPIVVAASGAIVVPAAASAGGPAGAAIAPSAFLACIGGITFLLACHREGNDRDDLAAMAAKNAELVAEGEVQKKRIEARAAELRRAHDELDRAQRMLSDQRRALTRSETIVSLTRETADVVHETMAPLATMLGALSEARALADEYARSLDYPDTTDADHRAIAERMARSLDRARQAAEKSAALVHSADVELHQCGKPGPESRRRVAS